MNMYSIRHLLDRYGWDKCIDVFGWDPYFLAEGRASEDDAQYVSAEELDRLEGHHVESKKVIHGAMMYIVYDTEEQGCCSSCSHTVTKFFGVYEDGIRAEQVAKENRARVRSMHLNENPQD